MGSGAQWGSITGVLANQTDLQSALNAKADDSAVLKKDGSVAITANWNVDGANTLYIDKTNGRVGVGTVAPTNPIDVHINSNLTQNDLIRLTQDGPFASAPVGISFFNSAGNVQMASIEAIPGTSYTASQLRFFVANSSKVRTQRMVIDVNGNVGIGTTNPGSLLTVGNNTFQVNSAGNLVKINNVTYSWPSTQGGANTVLINDGSGNLSWGTVSGGGGGGISGSGASGQVTFWTGASSVSGSNNLFWDDTNNRLGIGTTSPSEKLHVVGNALTTGTGTFQSSPLTIGNLVLSHTGLTASIKHWALALFGTVMLLELLMAERVYPQ
jgi:hypothetical protein